MNAVPNIEMLKATRLTREGRLAEAMAVLGRALSPLAPSAKLEDSARTTPHEHTPTTLELSPSMGEAGGSRTSQFEAHGTDGPGSLNRQLPETVCTLLDRLKKFGSLRRIDGWGVPTGRRAPLATAAGAKFEQHIYANTAGSRTYKLYVPSSYTGQPLPLVVMLHGCTQSPDDFAAGTRMNDLAEEQMFLVAYPAQPQSANPAKCWNWFNASDQQRDEGEPSLIAGITRRIVRDFPIEPGRVYIAGLSAGGATAAIMGATYPDLYAAIGVHSGLAPGSAQDIPSAFAAMRQGSARPSVTSPRLRAERAVPTIVFHGDRDTTVNPVNADQIIAQSKTTAALRTIVTRGQAPGGTGYTCTVQADENGRAILEKWVLHDAGHAWSGGSVAGSYTDPRGPDASREMMRFFRQHSFL